MTISCFSKHACSALKCAMWLFFGIRKYVLKFLFRCRFEAKLHRKNRILEKSTYTAWTYWIQCRGAANDAGFVTNELMFLIVIQKKRSFLVISSSQKNWILKTNINEFYAWKKYHFIIIGLFKYFNRKNKSNLPNNVWAIAFDLRNSNCFMGPEINLMNSNRYTWLFTLCQRHGQRSSDSTR